MLLHGLSLGVNAWRSVTAGGGGGALQNDTLPSFVQPDGAGGWEAADPVSDNQDVMLDVGEWSGGTEPYSFEYAIYDASDDSVIVARTTASEIDLSGLTGLTIYGRVWCIDALANEVSADTADFGPIVDGSGVPLLSVSFKSAPGTAPYEEIEPEVAFTGGTYPTLYTNGASSFTCGYTSGSSSFGTGTGSTDRRLRNRDGFTSSTKRWRGDLAQTGFVGTLRIWLSASVLTSSGTANLELFYGDPGAGGQQIMLSSPNGHLNAAYASGETVDATNTPLTFAQWVSSASGSRGGNYIEFVADGTQDSIFIRRRGSPTTTAYINHIHIEGYP